MKIGIYALCGAVFLCSSTCAPQDIKSKINNYYGSMTGFGISQEDTAAIQKAGGAPTYGEITCEGAEILLKKLNPSKDDKIVDAGSGIGKFIVQAFLSTPLKCATGIELSRERSQKSQEIQKKIMQDVQTSDRILKFKNQNILDADLTGTTIFFMCSTCFSEELMKKIMEKLVQLKPGLKVVTLKKLPDDNRFELLETLNLPMTWSASTPVHIYQLKK